VVVAVEQRDRDLRSEHVEQIAITPSVGITPAELARRANRRARHRALSPEVLARWLVEGGLAVERDGLLIPTELCIEIGSASPSSKPGAPIPNHAAPSARARCHLAASKATASAVVKCQFGSRADAIVCRCFAGARRSEA
jgi:hypothetical protein